MPPSSVSGTCSVSRRSVSGSYSATADLPLTVVGKRPRRGSGSALLWTFLMTSGAASDRLPSSLSALDFLGGVGPFWVDALNAAKAASTVTFQ